MTRMVSVSEARAHLGYCAKGMRKFITTQGWNLEEVLRDGIPLETLKATGDHMALEVARKIEEADHGLGQ